MTHCSKHFFFLIYQNTLSQTGVYSLPAYIIVCIIAYCVFQFVVARRERAVISGDISPIFKRALEPLKLQLTLSSFSFMTKLHLLKIILSHDQTLQSSS